MEQETGETINRKCNLYIYFLFWGLIRSRKDGLVSALVPYEWVSRPSAAPLRNFIQQKGWHVDVYKFSYPVFEGVLTTASISVIDKRNRDGRWMFFRLARDGEIAKQRLVTGSSRKLLPHEDRGSLWAKRGMSPGTQKVFTLTEGERIHAGLSHDDVLPCLTSLRHLPTSSSRLTKAVFRKRFVEAGVRCWLIKSHQEHLSRRLQAYLDSVPASLRETSTCTSRDPWYRYPLFDAPRLLLSSGFSSFGPKMLINTVKAHAVGAVCGIYSDNSIRVSQLRDYLAGINFERQVVPHAKTLKKVEIRQLNAVLNAFEQRNVRDA